MSWRSVVISKPAYLSLHHHALRVQQEGQSARIPLEDISVLLIDHPRVSLSAQLLSACATEKIVVLTVDAQHHPNGISLPFLPHHRLLKVLRLQMALTKPKKKRLHQQLIRQKISNQATLLEQHQKTGAALQLSRMAKKLASGDPDNDEAQAAQLYFRQLYSTGFTRQQPRFYNVAMNYGYALIRAALARSLVCHGLLPVLGLFHHNAYNPFNLADDLIEPFRPCMDAWILHHYPGEPAHTLGRADKQCCIRFLHTDLSTTKGSCSVLALSEALVSSLVSVMTGRQDTLLLPVLSGYWPYPQDDLP